MTATFSCTSTAKPKYPSGVATVGASCLTYYTSREDGIFVVAAKPEFDLLAHTKLEDDDSIFNASPVPLRGGSVLLRSDNYLYRLKPAN